jgi:hypothetical protein
MFFLSKIGTVNYWIAPETFEITKLPPTNYRISLRGFVFTELPPTTYLNEYLTKTLDRAYLDLEIKLLYGFI